MIFWITPHLKGGGRGFSAAISSVQYHTTVVRLCDCHSELTCGFCLSSPFFRLPEDATMQPPGSSRWLVDQWRTQMLRKQQEWIWKNKSVTGVKVVNQALPGCQIAHDEGIIYQPLAHIHIWQCGWSFLPKDATTNATTSGHLSRHTFLHWVIG